ncbi:hypothetical protein SUGI_0505180 [Cryptomeria japonica]|nr:hypothetical protein SUGI_0505180 [Cryptomeria japonica]
MASSKSTSSAPVLPLALHRSLSPTRHSPLLTFQLTTSTSPNTNLHAPSLHPKSRQRATVPSASARKMCLCSPSNHPGAFRCTLHKYCPSSSSSSSSSASTNSQLYMLRSAMKNSLVRMGSVERGEWMKKALPTLIRPSSHQLRRRRSFYTQPSKLRHMTTAKDVAVS